MKPFGAATIGLSLLLLAGCANQANSVPDRYKALWEGRLADYDRRVAMEDPRLTNMGGTFEPKSFPIKSDEGMAPASARELEAVFRNAYVLRGQRAMLRRFHKARKTYRSLGMWDVWFHEERGRIDRLDQEWQVDYELFASRSAKGSAGYPAYWNHWLKLTTDRAMIDGALQEFRLIREEVKAYIFDYRAADRADRARQRAIIRALQ